MEFEVQAGAKWRIEANGGIEVLMLSSTRAESGDALRLGSWLSWRREAKNHHHSRRKWGKGMGKVRPPNLW